MQRSAVLLTLTLVGAALFVVTAPSPAGACSCVRMTLASKADAEAVFTGRIDTSAPRPGVERRDGEGPTLMEVTIDVDDVYKGAVHERQRLVTIGKEQCGGVEITPVQSVFLAQGPELRTGGPIDQPTGVYWGNLCNSAPVRYADFDLADLGSAMPPLPGDSPGANRGSAEWRDRLWPEAPIAGLATIGLGAAAVALLRRRRRAFAPLG